MANTIPIVWNTQQNVKVHVHRECAIAFSTWVPESSPWIWDAINLPSWEWPIVSRIHILLEIGKGLNGIAWHRLDKTDILSGNICMIVRCRLPVLILRRLPVLALFDPTTFQKVIRWASSDLRLWDQRHLQIPQEKRLRGDRYNNGCVVQKDRWGNGHVMFWECISYHHTICLRRHKKHPVLGRAT